jgi:hypothetical protein
VGEDEWETVDGVDCRTILSFDEIFDVSPVTYPAYPDTDVSLRELDPATVHAGCRTGMRPEDASIIRECVRTLRFLIDSPAPDGGGSEAPQDCPQGRSISQLKRRLRVLELETSL